METIAKSAENSNDRIGQPLDIISPIFDVADFDGSGQYIVRGSTKYGFENFVNGGRASTFISKVGYDLEPRKKGQGSCHLIAISDGWTRHVGTKADLVEFLNNNRNGDIFRWATEDELILVIKAQAKYRVKG